MVQFFGFRIALPASGSQEWTGDDDFVKTSPLSLQNQLLLKQLILNPRRILAAIDLIRWCSWKSDGFSRIW